MNMHRKNVLKLYKTIRRLHRSLPEDLQALGNLYVRDEFKAHKHISAEQTAQFMSEWASYAITIANQIGLKGPKSSTGKLGIILSQDDLEQFKDEQLHQLYELMETAKNLK